MKKLIELSSIAFCLLLLLSYSFGLDEEEQNFSVLKSIDYQKLEGTLEVNIAVDGAFTHQPFELRDPLRLVIDISPVNKILSSLKTDVNDFGVLSIRTAFFQPLIARIVFDFLDQILDYDILRTQEGLKVILRPEVKRTVTAAPEEEQIPAIAKDKVQQVPRREKVARENFYNTMIGPSVGTYRISDDRYQEVYPGSGTIFGISLSRILFSYQSLDFDISLEARTFSKSGASTVTLEEAKFTMTPLSATARCLFQTKYAILFLGVGVDHYLYKEESDLYPTSGFISGSASGSHVQAGIYFQFPKLNPLRAKLYFKSTKVLTTENDSEGNLIEVNLGGKEFGFSLSYGFNIF